jgi:Reverse transcriptase (RNA-dependent DNA polymerase)
VHIAPLRPLDLNNKAIQAELKQIELMGTWKLVEKPHHKIPISNKFVFTKKRDKDRTILKYKARLVARGFTQRPGFNYVNTHSPVVRLETIRAILAIAPLRKLHIHQLDVKGAYLNGTLKEEVYMQQPEGYGDGTSHVCKLIKSLYGLKQAGREWNLELDCKLRKRKYMRLRSDPCVYIYHTDDDFVIITVWVDDMLLFATTIELKQKAITDIESEWEITNLGIPTKIVGIELAISADSIMISSSGYINLILIKEC